MTCALARTRHHHLLLDEPTNRLLPALADYDGALVIASHASAANA